MERSSRGAAWARAAPPVQRARPSSLGSRRAIVSLSRGRRRPRKEVPRGELMRGLKLVWLTIGDSVPLSGDLADFGPPGQKAADVAGDVINDAIDEAGVDHTVNVVHEDNCGGSDQQCAVQAARKMVESDNASCIAGAWASADTLPTAESVAIPEQVPLISPASTSDEITGLDDDGLVNRTAPPDSFQGPTLSEFLVEKALGGAEGMTVNVGARNDAYGTGLDDTFSEAWEAAGGEIGQDVVYDIKLPNYDSEAEQIVSGNPDGIVIVDFPETYNKVGPALVRAGFDPEKTFVTDGLISGDLAAGAGADAVNGLRGTAPGVPDGDPSEEAFDQLYTDAEPKDVDRQTFDAQNFDAVILCYLAAVAAGSTDGAEMADHIVDISAPPGDQFTFERLPDAIEALQDGDDIDYQGASGPIDMNDAGDATAGVYDIYEFQNGAPKAVDEIEVQQPEGG